MGLMSLFVTLKAWQTNSITLLRRFVKLGVTPSGMVQINVTVYKLGSQSQRRFGISSGRRQKSRSWWGIAQSHQPITGDIGQTTAHERTLPLMQTPACNPVIMPNGQESQHA